MERLATHLLTKINANLPHVIRNGDPIHTYPGCVNLSFAFVEGMFIQSVVFFCISK